MTLKELEDERERVVRDINNATQRTGSAHYGLGGYIRIGSAWIDELDKRIAKLKRQGKDKE